MSSPKEVVPIMTQDQIEWDELPTSDLRILRTPAQLRMKEASGSQLRTQNSGIFKAHNDSERDYSPGQELTDILTKPSTRTVAINMSSADQSPGKGGTQRLSNTLLSRSTTYPPSTGQENTLFRHRRKRESSMDISRKKHRSRHERPWSSRSAESTELNDNSAKDLEEMFLHLEKRDLQMDQSRTPAAPEQASIERRSNSFPAGDLSRHPLRAINTNILRNDKNTGTKRISKRSSLNQKEGKPNPALCSASVPRVHSMRTEGFLIPKASLLRQLSLDSEPERNQELKMTSELISTDHQESQTNTYSADEFNIVGELSQTDILAIDALMSRTSDPTKITHCPSHPCSSAADITVLSRSPDLSCERKEDEEDPFADFPDCDLAVLDEVLGTKQKKPVKTIGLTVFTRYMVLSVEQALNNYTKKLLVKEWTNDMISFLQDLSIHGKSSPKLANLPSVADGEILLEGEWFHSQIESGDFVHVVSIFGGQKTDASALPMVLKTNPDNTTSDDLVLVIHPDTLVPPTMLSESLSCTRRAILRSRLGSSGLSSRPALIGTIRHEIFEKCLLHNDFSFLPTLEFAKEAVRAASESIVALGMTATEARAEVMRFFPHLKQFASKYIAGKENQSGKPTTLIDGNGILPDVPVIIDGVHCTEESKVSVALGMKGNIDATVKTRIGDSQVPKITSLELKTGHNQKCQHAHMAQLAVYTLLQQSELGSGGSDFGVLLYLNHLGNRAVRIAPRQGELKSLIVQRNVCASELKRAANPRGVQVLGETTGFTLKINPPTIPQMPPPLSSSFSCKKCYANRECMIYAAAERSLTSDPFTTDETHATLFKHFTAHLEKQDLDYFIEWDRLIDIEAHGSSRLSTHAWLQRSEERESGAHSTVGKLVLTDTSVKKLASASPGNLDISFRKCSMEVFCNLTQCGIEKGALAIISTDTTSIHSGRSETAPRMCICRGCVTSVHHDTIVIKVASVQARSLLKKSPGRPIFRIDKDEVSTGLGTLRQNLVNLFSADVDAFESVKDPRLTQGQSVRHRYSRRRDEIVRFKHPIFGNETIADIFSMVNGKAGISGCDPVNLRRDFDNLNTDQQRAVLRTIQSKDYVIVQGMPGSGKTSTCVFIARLMAARGKRVLITSYTHSAVDNLMLKLIEKGLSTDAPVSRLVRLGKLSACHPSVRPIHASNLALFLESDASQTLPSADTLSRVVSEARIVGATALSVPRIPLLVSQNFDVVIVDEAGQITQPAVLGPLMAADSFVLVGDHEQLPPLVVSEAAEKAGYGISLLRRLADRHPSAVTQLTLQYRMNERICQLSNDIIYQGALNCATQEVSSRRLRLTGFPKMLRKGDRWLIPIVNPSRPVVFVNTDECFPTKGWIAARGLERKMGGSGRGNVVNDFETKLLTRIIQGLLDCGTHPSAIAIISPFRAQLQIVNQLSNITEWKRGGLEVSTIDRFQGRDKDIVLLSFVRSNRMGKSGRLLDDYRRLNVAVSRAKTKLIMIGSFSTLQSGSEDVLRPLLERLQERRQLQSLPKDLNL